MLISIYVFLIKKERIT